MTMDDQHGMWPPTSEEPADEPDGDRGDSAENRQLEGDADALADAILAPEVARSPAHLRADPAAVGPGSPAVHDAPADSPSVEDTSAEAVADLMFGDLTGGDPADEHPSTAAFAPVATPIDEAEAVAAALASVVAEPTVVHSLGDARPLAEHVDPFDAILEQEFGEYLSIPDAAVVPPVAPPDEWLLPPASEDAPASVDEVLAEAVFEAVTSAAPVSPAPPAPDPLPLLDPPPPPIDPLPLLDPPPFDPPPAPSPEPALAAEPPEQAPPLPSPSGHDDDDFFLGRDKRN